MHDCRTGPEPRHFGSRNRHHAAAGRARELVFQAWTDPEHIVQWWGPDGFRTTIHEMDVRPGGVWRFVMHGPDGTDYKNEVQYLEIVRPERLVYLHVSTPKFQMTVTFEDRAGKTELTMRMRFDSAQQRETVARQFGAVEGAKQTLGRLADYLPGMR